MSSTSADRETGAETAAPASEELSAVTGWIQQAGELSLDLSMLLGLELRLAASDLGRLFALTMLLLPILLLAWIGVSICLSWIAFLLTGLPTAAFITFPLLQAVLLLIIRQRCRQYSKSLSLPRVRQHLQAIIRGQENESHAVDP